MAASTFPSGPSDEAGRALRFTSLPAQGTAPALEPAACAVWGRRAISAFLICQAVWIPVTVIPGVTWALWPLPGDLAWLGVLATWWWHRTQASAGDPLAPLRRTAKFFLVYVLAAYALAWLRLELEATRLNYLAWNLLRAFQAYTLCDVASRIRHPAATRRCLSVFFAAATVGGLASLAQAANLFQYADLVRHIPPDLRVSGPWAYVARGTSPQPLGTFNYNHVMGSHLLAIAALLALACVRRRLVAAVLLVIFGLGLLVQQSGTSILTLLAGAIVLGKFLGRTRPIAATALLATAAWMLWFYTTLPNRDALWRGAAVEPRSDSIETQLLLRWERNQIGLDIGLSGVLTLLTGVGWGNLRGVSPIDAAHGSPYTVFAELGLVGLLLVALIYRQAWKLMGERSVFARTMQAVLAACVITSPLNDLLEPKTAGYPFFLSLWCLIGLAMGHCHGLRLMYTRDSGSVSSPQLSRASANRCEIGNVIG